MTNLTRTETARQRVGAALRASLDDDARAAAEHLFAAELTLRRRDVGRADLARELEGVLTGDVTTPAARRRVREVASKLDAELSPAVEACAFVVASDGGAIE